MDSIENGNPGDCKDWIGGFFTDGGLGNTWVTYWYSPLDTPGNYLTAVGWLCHDCQDPWQLWQNTSNAKPGYFPFPKPKAGAAYAQLTLRNGNLNRGFISQMLQDTLIAGQEYCVEFYTRPFKWSKWVTNNIGVYFSPDSLDYYAYKQNLTPHLEAAQVISDTTIWTRVKGSYIANGTERFINLGNFRSDAGSTMIPSGFPIDPWFTYSIPTYLVDAVMLHKCSDTVFTFNLPEDTLLCPNEQLVLQPQRQGFLLEDTTTTYLWSTGSTDSIIIVTQPGTYWVHTTINQRFVAGDTIVVNYYPANYRLNMPDTVLFCEGEEATLLANPDPMQLTAYLWNTGSTLTGIKVRTPGLYWLNAQTPCYPLADSTWALQDFCESYLWVPNAFTPDGDGTNDYFEFQGAPQPVKLSIYDRWGTKVFYSDNYQNNWDGTYQGQDLQAGVYTYLIEYLFVNPNANQPSAPSGSERQVRGKVTIIR